MAPVSPSSDHFRLNIPAMTTRSNTGRDSASPYPPSSPSATDSDFEDSWSQCSNSALRTSIANIPESQLRSIIVKLADNNSHFERAITKELAYGPAASSVNTSPHTPTARRKSRTSRRSKAHRGGKKLSMSVFDAWPQKDRERTMRIRTQTPEVCSYHPGHLDEQVYEFLSRTPNDNCTFNVFRTVTMWSCCDEDEWSPGCVKAPAYPISEDSDDYDYEEEHPSTIKTPPTSRSQSDLDVYPDTDLDQQYGDIFTSSRQST